MIVVPEGSAPPACICSEAHYMQPLKSLPFYGIVYSFIYFFFYYYFGGCFAILLSFARALIVIENNFQRQPEIFRMSTNLFAPN